MNKATPRNAKGQFQRKPPATVPAATAVPVPTWVLFLGMVGVAVLWRHPATRILCYLGLFIAAYVWALVWSSRRCPILFSFLAGFVYGLVGGRRYRRW